MTRDPATIQKWRDSEEDEFWTLGAIIDELCISLLDTKVAFCMINSHRDKPSEEDERFNSDRGVMRRLYEEQARYKMYRTVIFRPPPVFVIHLKHLDVQLKRQLAALHRESKDFVIKEAIGRIYEDIDKRYYLLSARPLLKWRLEN